MTGTMGPVSARIKELLQLSPSSSLTLAEVENLTSMVCVAWNMSILQRKNFEHLFPSFDSSPEIRALVHGLSLRKERLFPEDDRLILGFEMKVVQGKPDLYISSIACEDCFLPDGSVREGVPSGNVMRWQEVSRGKRGGGRP